MIFRQLFDPETCTYTYLLADTKTGDAVLIDPVAEQVERDLRLLEELNLNLVYCLDTHVHADHVTGAGMLREKTGCRTAVNATAGVACADQGVVHGDRIHFGDQRIEVRETPGHTAGCLTFIVRDGDRILAFTGDALFIRGCGRTDFQQGDSHALYQSVHTQIFSLPDEAIIYPGHDYKGHHFTTVAEEKAHNPRLKTTISEDQFVSIMANLNLGQPKKLHLAVPANLGCGLTSEGEQNQERDIPEVSPIEASDLSVWRVIDVREPHEWVGELGCIDIAERIPQASVASAATHWDRTDPLLLVCRSGRRSRNVAATLIDMGFSNVSNLTGGMIAWNATHANPE